MGLFRLIIRAYMLFLLTGCGAMVVGGGDQGSYRSTHEARSSQEIRSDSSITSTVNSRYVKDPQIDALDIKVQTDRGVVTLHGHVHSEYDARRAIKIAANVAGVINVVSRLQVTSH